MEQLGMKTLDVSFRASDSKVSVGKVGKTSDDFLTMLQNKQADAQPDKEVSEDTKPKKDSVSDDTKKEPVSDDKGQAEKPERPEKPEEDTSQTEGMLAAYHASQGLRPEIIQMTPETEEAPAEEVVLTAVTDIAAEAEAAMEGDAVQAPETAAVQPIRQESGVKQPDMEMDTAEGIRTVDTDFIAQAQPAETKEERSDLLSGSKEEKKTVQPERADEAQPEHLAAGQMAAAAETPKAVQTEKPVHEHTTVVHVKQPEELPEKVTDQLLTKLAEGVREFEIQIAPANLGKIAIKVMYEGNQANISIVCSEKRAWEALGQNAREIGNIIERNLGGETTIVVEKQETDYLNQTRDENEQARQEEQQKQKGQQKDQNGEDAEQFLQKLRLGLAG